MRKINDLRMKLLRFAGMSVMVLACFAMLSLTAYAAEGKVTASAAKIRKDASTSSEAVGLCFFFLYRHNEHNLWKRADVYRRLCFWFML